MIDSIDIEELRARTDEVIEYIQREDEALVIRVGDRNVAVIRPFTAGYQLELDRADRQRSIEGIAGCDGVEDTSPLDRPPSSYERRF